MLLRVRGRDPGPAPPHHDILQVPGHGSLWLHQTDGLHHQDVLRVSQDGRQGPGPLQVQGYYF